MRDEAFKRRLRRAETHQNLTKSPYAKYTQGAKNKLGDSHILPIAIISISIYCYAHRKISDAKKAARYEEHEDIEKQALRWNGTVARWTTILALVGIAGIYFNWRTLNAVQGQLDEMRSGSSDTHTLAEAARVQAEAAKSNARTAQDAFTANQRAWIGTTDASLLPLEAGKKISARVSYSNFGHEPAKNVLYYMVVKTIRNIEFGSVDTAKQTTAFADSCFVTPNADRTMVVFPTTNGNNYFLNAETTDAASTGNSVVSGNFVIINGCFAYETVSQLRHEAFCYYYQPGKTDISHLSICVTGNRAD